MRSEKVSRIVFYTGLLLWIIFPGEAVSEEGRGEMMQPVRLLDLHTAGILPRATFSLEMGVYPPGDPEIRGAGLSTGISVGITDRLNIGISYGADGLVGRGRVDPNPYPGALVKYRLFEEGYINPALVLGYDHQGYGGIEPDSVSYGGFVYKSQGLFAALSKNFRVFDKLQIGFHGGLNFSFEDLDNVTWPDLYAGMDLEVNEELAFTLAYDFALDQVDPCGCNYAYTHNGFLNAGVRWAFSREFYIEFMLKDILENKLSHTGRRKGWTRELKLVYIKEF